MTVAEFMKSVNELIAVNPNWAAAELVLSGKVPVTAFGYGGNDNIMMLLTAKDIEFVASVDDTPQYG